MMLSGLREPFGGQKRIARQSPRRRGGQLGASTRRQQGRCVLRRDGHVHRYKAPSLPPLPHSYLPPLLLPHRHQAVCATRWSDYATAQAAPQAWGNTTHHPTSEADPRLHDELDREVARPSHHRAAHDSGARAAVTEVLLVGAICWLGMCDLGKPDDGRDVVSKFLDPTMAGRWHLHIAWVLPPAKFARSNVAQQLPNIFLHEPTVGSLGLYLVCRCSCWNYTRKQTSGVEQSLASPGQLRSEVGQLWTTLARSWPVWANSGRCRPILADCVSRLLTNSANKGLRSLAKGVNGGRACEAFDQRQGESAEASPSPVLRSDL